MMADNGRLVCLSTRLTFPAATRSATWSAVRPVAGVVVVAAGALGALDALGTVGAVGLEPTRG
jgi:hypothetical protein